MLTCGNFLFVKAYPEASAVASFIQSTVLLELLGYFLISETHETSREKEKMLIPLLPFHFLGRGGFEGPT